MPSPLQLDPAAPAMFEAQLEPQGLRFGAPAGQTLLQSAIAAGIGLESSCRNGTCRSCICRLDSGQVNYRIEWPGLSADEKAAGFILPCVAYPVSDVVMTLVML